MTVAPKPTDPPYRIHVSATEHGYTAGPLALPDVFNGCPRFRNVWFFRVIELADGRWACRHGRLEYDTHDELRRAVEHMRPIARAMRPAQLLLHRLDGSVELVETIS